MKILLVVTSLEVGGAERLVTNLADCFRTAGHDVVLAYFHGKPKLIPSDPYVKLVDLGFSRSFSGVIRGSWRLRKLLKNFRPDVVNSHLVHANILTRLLRLITHMPRLVSSAHNTNEEGRLRMLAYRMTDRLADISTNVSTEAVQAFELQRALRPGRMVAIYNGIDTQGFIFDEFARLNVRRELGIDASTPLLLAVGRLYESKDYPNLLQAFAALQPSSVLPRLAIAGGGPSHKELLSLAESLRVADRVIFLGVRYDVPALLSACDLFVLSSAWEGFGLVVAEAMACERVVVATDCGGVEEVVGDAGYLVPPHDSAALATALNRALHLPPEESERLGRAGRERVELQFSLDVTANRYLAIYEGRWQKSIQGGNS